MPGLNEILTASILEGVRRKGKKGMKLRPWEFKGTYSEMKQSWGQTIAIGARVSKMPAIAEDSHWVYLIKEPNRRRDPSNVLAGAMKLVEDGLQECGALKNDGWRHVAGIQPKFRVVKNAPGVVLFVGPRPMTETELENIE